MATILLFDSGMGGLSVYQEVRRLLPDHHYLYGFDNANFPYGELTDQALIQACSAFIFTMAAHYPIDLVVIACNTASTLVLPTLRAGLSVPVVGVVPAIKPAVALSQSGRIGLLATPGTVRRPYLRELIDAFAPHCAVALKGSTELVRAAEDKLAGLPVDLAALQPVLADWQQGAAAPDVVVLGCTHFPLLSTELQTLLPHAQLVDSGHAVAKRVAQLLAERNLAPEAHPYAEAFCSRLDASVAPWRQALLALGFSALKPLPER
ncbi:MAG: glutamate racemase [Aeromonas sp.]